MSFLVDFMKRAMMLLVGMMKSYKSMYAAQHALQDCLRVFTMVQEIDYSDDEAEEAAKRKRREKYDLYSIDSCKRLILTEATGKRRKRRDALTSRLPDRQRNQANWLRRRSGNGLLKPP